MSSSYINELCSFTVSSSRDICKTINGYVTVDDLGAPTVGMWALDKDVLGSISGRISLGNKVSKLGLVWAFRVVARSEFHCSVTHRTRRIP